MGISKKVAFITKARTAHEGAGVLIHRGFSFGSTEQFDPFLLFDDFSSDARDDHELGFPFHPHRGMETVTYVLEGTVRHRDSLGNVGVLGAGDIQWMTAGSGIIHEEMPGTEDTLTGFQLWINLPHAKKMTSPRYQEIKAADIPAVMISHGSVKVIAGTFEQTTGPVRGIYADPQYLDVSLNVAATFTHVIPNGHTLFLYVITGSLALHEGASLAEQGSIILYERIGDTMSVTARTSGTRFLLISGNPLNEPVAWRGPIVMNTEAELAVAFAELQTGDFVKIKK
jgi:quercetin 2,3-dioxygenase